MNFSILRSAGSVILGLLVALGLLIAVEGFSALVHPFPQDFSGSIEELVKHVARYPNWVLVVCALLWCATVFIATWLATRLGSYRHPAHGIVVGLILLVALVFNMYSLPYPLWFEVIILLLFPSGIYCGVKLGRAVKVKYSALV